MIELSVKKANGKLTKKALYGEEGKGYILTIENI